jgi:hypothetical protein
MTMAMRPAKSDDSQTKLATQRTRLRDPEQKELDADVAKLVAEWDAAGQPTEGDPNRRYETNDPAESKRRVRRAFTLVSKDRTPKLAPMWWTDGAKDAEGFLPIKFGVRVSVPSDDAESAAAESETPKTDPDAADPNPNPVGDDNPGEGDQAPFDQGNGDQEGEPTPETARGFRRGRR